MSYERKVGKRGGGKVPCLDKVENLLNLSDQFLQNKLDSNPPNNNSRNRSIYLDSVP